MRYIDAKNTNEILMHIDEQQFNIVYLKNKFIFYNQFNFDYASDFLYYFTNCLNILDINQYNTKLNIISNLENTHVFQHDKRLKAKYYILKKQICFYTTPN